MTEAKRGPGRPRKNVEARPARTPLGVPRQKLSVAEKDPNYNYRWINDTGDRIQRALDAGYEFVKRGDTSAPGDKDVVSQNTDLGNCVSKVVGTTDGGKNLSAYLMRLKKSFYEEDKKAKEAHVDELEVGIKQGQRLRGDIGDNAYVKQSSFKRD